MDGKANLIETHIVRGDGYSERVRIEAVGFIGGKDIIEGKGAGGAYLRYLISVPESNADTVAITFQHGNPEVEINGISNEALVAVVLDRLKGFQTGKFSTRETAVAVTKLEEALMWMQKRTEDRLKRGVLGKLVQ